eukprot:1159664-Pelagomonas_calceolata.AAC.5
MHTEYSQGTMPGHAALHTLHAVHACPLRCMHLKAGHQASRFPTAGQQLAIDRTSDRQWNAQLPRNLSNGKCRLIYPHLDVGPKVDVLAAAVDGCLPSAVLLVPAYSTARNEHSVSGGGSKVPCTKTQY